MTHWDVDVLNNIRSGRYGRHRLYACRPPGAGGQSTGRQLIDDRRRRRWQQPIRRTNDGAVFWWAIVPLARDVITFAIITLAKARFYVV
jgi:hypothetical protein